MEFKALLLIFEIVTSAIGYSLIAPLFPKFAREVGLDSMQIGLIFSSFAIANVMVIPFIPTIVSYVGRKRLLYLALIVEVKR